MNHYSELPSLNSLVIFEAVARHESFSKAAQERCVTPAALSYQIRMLEERLGTRLFIRATRQIRLTQAGKLLLTDVRAGLVQIERGIQRSRDWLEKGPLGISLVPSFAQHWFLPRMAEFSRLHPEIDLHINASQELCDFRGEAIQLAIRYGLGAWPSLSVRPFLQDRVIAVCRPSLLPDGLPCRSPAELLTLPLIHDSSYPWNRFLESVGYRDKAPAKGPIFNDTNLLLSAATAGMGIILVRQLFAEALIRDGVLIQAFTTSVPADRGYFLVCPQHHLQIPKVAKLITWLEAQVNPVSPIGE